MATRRSAAFNDSRRKSILERRSIASSYTKARDFQQSKIHTWRISNPVPTIHEIDCDSQSIDLTTTTKIISNYHYKKSYRMNNVTEKLVTLNVETMIYKICCIKVTRYIFCHEKIQR